MGMAEKNGEEFQSAATRVSLVSMITNVVLTLLKLAAGLIAHSGAMISDAVHSASDIFSGLIVLIGVKISSKEPDEQHPYGHERYECVAALLLSGCHAFEKQHQAGAKVEVNGHYLYGSTLDALTLGLSPQDSARIAEQYISQWAKDMLVYDNARAKVLPELESLVEDYRRTLYVHAYEEYLIERRMPKTVADSAVEKVYNQMPDRFKLDESIL